MATTNGCRHPLPRREVQALLLPGRVPGLKRTDVKLLPSTLKHSLWKTYQDLCNNDCRISVGYSKFCDLWNQLCPFIIIMQPAADLCWTCQKNNSRIHKSANLPEAQKAQVVKAQEEHLCLASGERDFYKTCCKESKDSVAPHLRNFDFSNEQQPCSYAGTVHYSYDYAQQLHYPANPNQPGPIYFKTPGKCALFGKEYWNSEERAINTLQNAANLPEPGELPQIVNPKGMSRERREDLYKEFREFCRTGTEDLVTPQLY